MESNRWLLIAFLAGGLLIGAAAYSVGVSQGTAHAVAAAGGANVDTVDAYWGWRHGPGYWGFPFGPLLAVFFWVWIIRALFWGGRPWGWRRRWRYYDDYEDDSRRLHDWHRRAHERMGEEKSKV